LGLYSKEAEPEVIGQLAHVAFPEGISIDLYEFTDNSDEMLLKIMENRILRVDLKTDLFAF
jgi:hypothetical protein